MFTMASFVTHCRVECPSAGIMFVTFAADTEVDAGTTDTTERLLASTLRLACWVDPLRDVASVDRGGLVRKALCLTGPLARRTGVPQDDWYIRLTDRHQGDNRQKPSWGRICLHSPSSLRVCDHPSQKPRELDSPYLMPASRARERLLSTSASSNLFAR